MTYLATYFTAFTSDMLLHRFVTTSLKFDDLKFSEQLDDNSHVVDKDDFGNTVPCSTSRMLNTKLAIDHLHSLCFWALVANVTQEPGEMRP